jgi:DNA-directed RNA polymerase specialized sigma24 family protein
VTTQRDDLSAEFLTRLRAFVRSRVRSAHDAEDIVQDVLTKFIQHDDSIDSRSIYAWLFTVERRNGLDHNRDR